MIIMTLILRAHHLLCLQGFQGYGYDEKFVENMIKVNEKRKIKDTKIKVVNTPDDLCKACPNLKNGICESTIENNKIISMDDEVLKKLPKKDYFKSEDLFEIINKRFKSRDDVKDICLGCKWHDLCIFIKNIENRYI